MALAVVIFLLVIGSVVFHFASPWWFTDIAADWGSIDFTINLTFWVTGFVFIVTNLFLFIRKRECFLGGFQTQNQAVAILIKMAIKCLQK